ncbi:hypothetical protein [Actinomadura sp. HBU206391]|uniref:hypothetical protein n=1 Tax=Actinomadura sp. HBU206391 TaxID=2731692 RepID=UPI0016509F1F|nr:hypothetical protein [Actinomadura sp. HBU206391]MBC6457127.1 hypothetical protein [Actinomadura sp. HBU206391]
MRGRVLGAVGAGAVAIATVTILVWPGPGAPQVEPRLRAELTPVIRQHLETRDDHGGALAERPESKSRWFCQVHLIETRRGGPELLAGIAAHCSEYARRGSALLQGTGFSVPALITLRSRDGSYEVTEMREGGKLNGDPDYRRTFTKVGKAEFLRIEQHGYPETAERPLDRARRAYGLPPNAPVQDAF